MLKKADILLIMALFLFSLFFYFIFDFSNGESKTVVISVDGVKIGAYDLGIDQEVNIMDKYEKIVNPLYHIDKINIAKIENGHISMIEASCHDSLCINQGSIKKSNQTIVCLPNKVVIEIEGSADDEIDAISN